MLKEVDASGQISLGKKYAGQLLDAQTTADGTFVLRPVKVVPMTPSAQEAEAQQNQAWAQAHAQDIEAYSAWATQSEPCAQRVRRWREESGKVTEPAHGTV